MTTILSLPNEILLNITDRLSYASFRSLSMTCRSFRILLPLPRPNCTIHDLLEIETWTKYHPAKDRQLGSQQPNSDDYFACSLCLKIKSSDNFSDKMMKGNRGKFANGSDIDSHRRFCIPCGVQRNLYPPGVKLWYGGGKRCFGFVCKVCHRFEGVQVGDFEHKNRLMSEDPTCPLC
ncbi:hypothetical protein EYR41_011724 [Orbilia oligospora]|uniref:Uncharacterized protein n=1 Tax=Orbilia oligospora TaxID=2813651 RepID=A0A7C8P9D6_ORBOL|nr:hypothetical protein TWF751_006804 [Orbilia oligospora]TGJ63834.1 hypothetical protein EYR41_011724 [Orbilia oligospora]